MKLELAAIVSKAIPAVAAAAMIGGGTMVLKNSSMDAVQQRDIEALKERQHRTDDALDKLTQTAQQLDKSVAVLNERLQK